VLPIKQRDYSTTLDKIGDLKRDQGDTQQALETYQQEVKVDRQITELKFGVSATDYTKVSLDLRKIAPLQKKLGDDAGARRSNASRSMPRKPPPRSAMWP